MQRKTILGGLLLLVCLTLMATSHAWQDRKGQKEEEKPPEKKEERTELPRPTPSSAWLKQAKKTTGSPYYPPASTQEPGNETITRLLQRMTQIKHNRAQLEAHRADIDKEERAVAEQIQSELNKERKKLDIAEQELRNIAPHLYPPAPPPAPAPVPAPPPVGAQPPAPSPAPIPAP